MREEGAVTYFGVNFAGAVLAEGAVEVFDRGILGQIPDEQMSHT